MNKREEYERNLGWCEEGQTYCSVSEKAYKENQFLKQWKADVVESLSKYDAETVEEVYRKGRADIRTRILKIIQEGEPTDIGRRVTIERIYDLVKEQKNDNI